MQHHPRMLSASWSKLASKRTRTKSQKIGQHRSLTAWRRMELCSSLCGCGDFTGWTSTSCIGPAKSWLHQPIASQPPFSANYLSICRCFYVKLHLLLNFWCVTLFIDLIFPSSQPFYDNAITFSSEPGVQNVSEGWSNAAGVCSRKVQPIIKAGLLVIK